MKKRDLIRGTACFIGASLIGVLIGDVVRQSWMDEASEIPARAEIVAPEPDRSESVIRLLTEHSKENTEQADALTKIPAVHRVLWLATQAEKASPTELERMLQLAAGTGDMQQAIAARWAAIDPAHMFASLGNRGIDDYDQILIATWSKSDPRGALEAMRDRKKNGLYLSSALLLADNLMREAPDIGIEAIKDLRLQGFLPSMDRIAEWASKDPREAAEKVATLGADYPGLGAISEVGKEWGSKEPEAAIEYAASLRSAIGDRFAEAAIAVWAEEDPTAAADFAAAEEDPDFRAQLAKGITAGLAKTDPAAAITWAEDNLRSTARAEAIGGIVKTLAENNIRTAADLVSTMNPGGAMNQAMNELMNVWGKGDLIQNDALFLWLEALHDADTRYRAIRSLERQLEMNHHDGLIDFVASKHGHLATDEMLSRAASQRTRQDPESAITWAKALPEDRSARALEHVMNTWRTIDPEAADTGQTE